LLSLCDSYNYLCQRGHVKKFKWARFKIICAWCSEFEHWYFWLINLLSYTGKPVPTEACNFTYSVTINLGYQNVHVDFLMSTKTFKEEQNCLYIVEGTLSFMSDILIVVSANFIRISQEFLSNADVDCNLIPEFWQFIALILCWHNKPSEHQLNSQTLILCSLFVMLK
jgi:hypothetical protein